MLVHRSVAKVFGENLKVKVGEMLGIGCLVNSMGVEKNVKLMKDTVRIGQLHIANNT